MINRHRKYLFLFLSIFIISGSLVGQESKEELESKRKKLEAEIEYTNQLINQTRKSKQTTVNELKLLSNEAVRDIDHFYIAEFWYVERSDEEYFSHYSFDPDDEGNMEKRSNYCR